MELPLNAQRALAEERWADALSALGGISDQLVRRLAIDLIAQGKGPQALGVLSLAEGNDCAKAQIEARAHMLARNPKAALAALNPFVKEARTDPGFLFNLGTIQRALGALDDAAFAFEAALKIEPLYGDAAYQLAVLGELDKAPDRAAAIERAYADHPRPEARAPAACYAAGRLFEVRGEIEKSFAAYQEGAAKMRASQNPNLQALARREDGMRAAFAPAALQQAPKRQSSENDPIFIVGLPRSGSTLVERILDAHPAMTGVGETSVVAKLFEEWRAVAPPKNFHPATFDRLGARYFELNGMVEGETQIIDKTLTNYMYLGFMALLFPSSSVIHIKRQPLDAGFSCFATLFGHGAGWTYDLEQIAFVMNRYDSLMTHWKRVLPQVPIEVSYEALVADPKIVVPEIIAAIGAPWDEACLAHHASSAPVYTASVVQARRPIYTGSVGRADPFRKYLAPLERTIRAGDAQ